MDSVSMYQVGLYPRMHARSATRVHQFQQYCQASRSSLHFAVVTSYL